MNTLNNDLLQGITVFIDNTGILTFRNVSVQFKTIATDRFTSLQTREFNAVHSVLKNTHAVFATLKYFSTDCHYFPHMGIRPCIDLDETTLIVQDFTHVLTCINSIIELCMHKYKAYDNNGKPIFAPGYYEIGNCAYNAYWSFSLEIIQDMYLDIQRWCEPKWYDDEYTTLEYDEDDRIIYIKHPEIGALLNKMDENLKCLNFW